MVIVIVALVLILVLTLLVLVRGALVSYTPAAVETLAVTGRAAEDAGEGLEVVTWNMGYAGLGARADFIADGGRRLRPRSVEEVETNLGAIQARLSDLDPDLFLLQELAEPGFLTRGVDVLGAIHRQLDPAEMIFTPTVNTGRLPWLGKIVVGKGTFARPRIARARRLSLPTAGDVAGLTVQHYNFLVTRLPVTGQDWEWVVLNIHLAAFDDGALRRAQLQAVVEFMEQEYRAGHRVVAGGDWNMLLAETDFPHTTSEKDKFWVRPLATGVVPEQWSWAADPTVPTCRTLERAYRAGENYTCVIDGFLVTPNVQILSVEGVDLGFEHTDHHPVILKVGSL